ncbi:MAG: o-succinylbenzoate synthase [Acidobacteria bacterium]|nr:o-succinylbenzoate synthase [Acidobacteriota bacterium]
MILMESVELREIRLPLIESFETSAGRTTERRIILATVRCAGGEGYGECTAGEDPYYSSETTDTAWHLLADFIIPPLLGKQIESAREVSARLRPIRGHEMAKAAIETALWDFEARSGQIPLSRHLGGIRDEIQCGVSIGIQAGVEELLRKVRGEIAAGYRRIKVKIKPGWDLEPLRAVRAEFPEVPLMADANAAYELDDLALFHRLDEFGLMMIEQPLAHDDLVDHARLQKEIRTPICLDEPIHGFEDARRAIELGSCRVLNVKLGRVGGYGEALRINEYCARQAVPVWCGGMLESGIGRAHNIALSTLSGFVLPGDVSASRRYYQEDTVRPPVSVTPGGTIRVPTSPGIGYDLDWARIDRATVRRQEFH